MHQTMTTPTRTALNGLHNLFEIRLQTATIAEARFASPNMPLRAIAPNELAPRTDDRPHRNAPPQRFW